jgi:iron complex outermembrane receptor protein
MVPRLGWDWDNYAPDWNRAVAAARGVFFGKVQTLDDAYFLGRGLRRDLLVGATLSQRVGTTYWSATLYSHRNRGQGHWYTPYLPSSPQVPISIRTTEYTVDRYGMINELNWFLDTHRVQAGLWIERNLHGLERNFYAVSGPESTERFLTDPMRRVYAQRFETQTLQAYVLDTFALLDDRLNVSLGFKSPRVTTEANSLLGQQASGRLESNAGFLPQLGLNYLFAPGREAFASLAENQRAFQPGVIGPFSQTKAAFDLSADKLRPEKSTTIELGYRFQGEGFSGLIALYNVAFKDRLLAVDTCVGISGCPAMFLNVGHVRVRGIESAAAMPLAPDWSLFASLTLNDPRYRSDYLDAGNRVAASGKDVVDSPRRLAAVELSYDNTVWYAKLGAKYTGRRYYTYLNDGSVPAATVGTLAIGKKLGNMGFAQDVELRLNINNLFNERYFATVGTNGYVSSDPGGLFQTLLAGAPRQSFVSVSAQF